MKKRKKRERKYLRWFVLTSLQSEHFLLLLLLPLNGHHQRVDYFAMLFMLFIYIHVDDQLASNQHFFAGWYRYSICMCMHPFLIWLRLAMKFTKYYLVNFHTSRSLKCKSASVWIVFLRFELIKLIKSFQILNYNTKDTKYK